MHSPIDLSNPFAGAEGAPGDVVSAVSLGPLTNATGAEMIRQASK